MQILLIQPEICHIFHYHVNIISKIMTKFFTELVEISETSETTFLKRRQKHSVFSAED